MNTNTLVPLLIFLEYILLFLDNNEDDVYEKFSNRKSSALDFKARLLDFLAISVWRCL